jgi:alpha-glucosidase
MRLLQKNILLLVGGLCGFCWTHACVAAEPGSAAPPWNAETQLKALDPFYKQHLVADGVLIVGSEKVSQYALHEVAYLARKVLANRPDVLKKLGETRKMYVCVMAYNEMQTDLPECRGMQLWWSYRARGLAGRPVSCGEENLLSFQGDPWQGENIFIHEFAHGFEDVIAAIDAPFGPQLRALYDAARKSGRFCGYGLSSTAEFWAEGVQAWFNCNGTIRPKSGGGQSSFEALGPQGEHVCHMTTRGQVQTHMPEFARLLDETFRQNEWVYVPVAKRLDEPHLRGFDPAKAPTFRWPPEVVEAFDRTEAAKAKAQEQPK